MDGAAEEPELDPALDEQRQVRVSEGLERGDRRPDHAETAELLGKQQRRAAGAGQSRGPPADHLAVLVGGRRLGALGELRAGERGPHVFAYLAVLAVEQ